MSSRVSRPFEPVGYRPQLNPARNTQPSTSGTNRRIDEVSAHTLSNPNPHAKYRPHNNHPSHRTISPANSSSITERSNQVYHATYSSERRNTHASSHLERTREATPNSTQPKRSDNRLIDFNKRISTAVRNSDSRE